MSSILNLEFTLKLKHLIFGYKISDNNYYGVNYFITILGFSIYKSYYLSEQKTKNVNIECTLFAIYKAILVIGLYEFFFLTT
jgi:hypothetical protein